MSAAGQAPPPAAARAALFLPVRRAAGAEERPEAAGWRDDEAAPLAGDADGEPGDADPDTPAARMMPRTPLPHLPPAALPAAALPYATADTGPLREDWDAGFPPAIPEHAQASSPITPRPATRAKNRRRQYWSASRARLLLR